MFCLWEKRLSETLRTMLSQVNTITVSSKQINKFYLMNRRKSEPILIMYADSRISSPTDAVHNATKWRLWLPSIELVCEPGLVSPRHNVASA